MNNRFDDPLPEIRGVDRDEKIYRIIDFFSAAQAIEDGHLYVPLASKFEDRNEALDAAIEMLSIAAGPCAGMTREFGSQNEFVQFQQSVANRNYVSCWTRTRESVAMWALYSTDWSSIQISTTVGELEKAAIAFAECESNPMSAIHLGRGDGQFVDRTKIAAVNYENMGALARKIDRRRRAYDKLETAGRIDKKRDIMSRGLRENQRATQYRFEALEHKDQSFSHESEIRLIINCAPFDTTTLQIAQANIHEMKNRPEADVDDPRNGQWMLAYARAILREEAWKRGMHCKPHIDLRLHPKFIKEVAIDPRCPDHKQRFMRKFFEARGITLSQSSCFGHAASNFVVQPRKRLGKDENERRFEKD